MSDVDVLHDAFPKLVDDYQDALYRFALRLTANPQDAEDIAQDAFVRAYRWLEAHGFRSVDTKPWLYRVTLNVFRNRSARRAWRRRRLKTPWSCRTARRSSRPPWPSAGRRELSWPKCSAGCRCAIGRRSSCATSRS